MFREVVEEDWSWISFFMSIGSLSDHMGKVTEVCWFETKL